MTRSKIHLLLFSLVACGGDDTDPAEATDAVSIDATLVDAAPDARLEPTPMFHIAHVAGPLAIDDSGLRADYRLDGVAGQSTLIVVLQADGAPDTCNVHLRPTFLGFTTRTTSNRYFKVLQLDPGTSTIVRDECGWDDEHMLRVMAPLGPIEIGWMRARFEEDRPYLDVYYGGPWLVDTAAIVFAGSGNGFAMSPDGVVSSSVRVQPLPGTLDPGLYGNY